METEIWGVADCKSTRNLRANTRARSSLALEHVYQAEEVYGNRWSSSMVRVHNGIFLLYLARPAGGTRCRTRETAVF